MLGTREDRVMKLGRQQLEGVTVVAVSEPIEIDAGNAEAFKEALLEAIADDLQIVLDATLVEFFDSAGMGVLLAVQKRLAQSRGNLVLAGLNRAIQEIFKMVGFDAEETLIDKLTSGIIDSLVVQDPHKMGYIGVKTLVDKINGKEVPKSIDTGVELVTVQRLEEPKIKALLNLH